MQTTYGNTNAESTWGQINLWNSWEILVIFPILYYFFCVTPCISASFLCMIVLYNKTITRELAFFNRILVFVQNFDGIFLMIM